MNEQHISANPAIPRRPSHPWAYELALSETDLAIHESVTQPFKVRDLDLAVQAAPKVEVSEAPSLLSYPAFVACLLVLMGGALGLCLWSLRSVFSLTELGLLGWCGVFAGGVITDACASRIERLYEALFCEG